MNHVMRSISLFLAAFILLSASCREGSWRICVPTAAPWRDRMRSGDSSILPCGKKHHPVI